MPPFDASESGTVSRTIRCRVHACIAIVARGALVLTIGLALASDGGAQQSELANQPPAIRAGNAIGAIRLDGEMREAEWEAADSIATLTQVEPREGAAASGRTVVRVLATSEALLIGVRADTPAGVEIVSFARNRDAWLDGEDHIKIVLDTYLDGRSGYVFAVNPDGARYDALIAGRGDDENEDWDAVWEAKTARTASGWSAEMRIPLKSILFRRGLESWGLNVQRRIEALQETDRWSGVSRNIEVTQMSRAGRLVGLPAFDLGIGLGVRPSLTTGGGYSAADAAFTHRSDVSLDATQRLGANTLASLTVNTDFAETEVDSRRTNLTRFPVFFPEKRTFFLEGSDIFEFGLGLGEDVRPFHSRRIGLLADQRVPLDVGLKVSGREHDTNFGALVVRTGDVAGVAPATGMGVVRVRQNVLSESSVGVIGTFGDPEGGTGHWLGGSDLTYQTSRFRGDRNLLIGVWGLTMNGDTAVARPHAFGAKIDYPNDLLELSASYKRLGEGFQPALAFVPRPGTQRLSLGVEYQPRPTRPILGLRVRQMFHDANASVVSDLGGRWESYELFTSPLNWHLESGDQFEFSVTPQGERLDEPFEIAEGVNIGAGAYHFTRYRLGAELASRRRLSGEYTWRFGEFYGGRLDQIEISTKWKPSSLIVLELSGERAIGRMSAGDFTKDLVSSRLQVNVSPDLQLNSYVQFDNESHSFGTNSRIRWTFTPLGELFVVYNHNLSHALVDSVTDRLDRQWAFASNQLLVKIQYAFRY